MLLLLGSEVRADGVEGLGILRSVEAARDLVLGFGHADGVFGEVVLLKRTRGPAVKRRL